MTRRHFLRSSLIAAAASQFGREGTAEEQPAKFILGAPLTHSDWMLKPGIKWGAEGVRHMLDTCKECGWSRIYWRVLDGGRALYQSKLLRPMGNWDDDSFWSP